MATSSFPRRFKVEPIETTVASSKDRSPRDREDRKCARKFPPELVETTTKTIRKFAPEPVETVVRSSKDKAGAGDERSSRTRRFAPEPVETSTRTNRRSEPEDEGLDKKRRSSKKFAEEWNDWESQLTFKSGKKEKRPSRKFVPQLIETARRSRRAGDACPTLRPSDKTEATPTAACSAHITIDTTSFKVPSPPANTPTFDYSHNPLFLEIQRATSPFSGRRSLPRRASKHCFQVPELDPIESSESEAEESAPSSPTTSPSISDRPSFYKEATRMRESVDDRFAGYLLKLAADAAEKQLREQALAAFPNDDFHEHVDHWMGREDTVSSDGDPQSRRDSSFNQVNWELVAMRKHREKLEQQREEELELERRREIEKKQNAWTQVAAQGDSSPKDIVGGYQKDDELDRMRKRARPPMLGKDIKFPRCPSPEPARFDTTQGCDVVRKAMCYLSEQSQAAEEKGESLWCGNGNGRQVSKVPSLWSTGSSRSASRSGLWGGCCVTSGETPPRGPTGILTPSNEKGNPVDTPCPTPSTYLLPPTPPASHADFACIDEKLAAELTIEEEYGDDFVTQVYNYLSLGYPVMARPFDEELSKISHIPVSELRQDDHLAQSRGYIRLGADGNLSSAEITEESCMRWRALRVYIREWAKQQPGMAGETIAGGMGTAVRRGSWAV